MSLNGEGGSEAAIRLGVFIGAFVSKAALERLWPRRELTTPRSRRWLTNIAIVVVDSLVVRAMAALSVPLAAVAAAFYAERSGWGLLNLVTLPGWLELLVAVVVLDFAIWLQHLLAHRIPVLWRLHQVHHADPDIDVTTAIRFHPLEIGFSMLYKIAWVLLLGASPVAVIAFEVILNACAMFNHANVALPGWLDRVLRLAVVTPDMHRVHHSTIPREHHTNFGFNLSIWDRLFATYTPQPEGGHEGMTIGLAPYGREAPSRIGWSLSVPFKRGRPPA